MVTRMFSKKKSLGTRLLPFFLPSYVTPCLRTVFPIVWETVYLLPSSVIFVLIWVLCNGMYHQHHHSFIIKPKSEEAARWVLLLLLVNSLLCHVDTLFSLHINSNPRAVCVVCGYARDFLSRPYYISVSTLIFPCQKKKKSLLVVNHTPREW